MHTSLDADLIEAACPCCRPALTRVLRSYAGRRVFIARRAVERPQDVRLAASLLQTLTVAESRDALMARLGCGRRKAYTLITEALRSRATPPPHTEDPQHASK